MKQRNKKYLVVGVIVALIFLLPGSSNAAARVEPLIKQLEESGIAKLQAYQDVGGTWTIGFGSTWNYNENRWVRAGDQISLGDAYKFMRNEIQEKVDAIKRLVKVPLSNNQFDALVSFTYNEGVTAFTGSKLLELLNDGVDKYTVADQFDKWIYVGQTRVQGLVNRRAIEKQLFLS